MECQTRDNISMAQYFGTVDEKYRRCRLLNVIQHIDIYGKTKTLYNEAKTRVRLTDYSSAFVTSVSTSPTIQERENESPWTNIESKLSRLTVTTKVSGLYPGYDMLSKRARKTLASLSISGVNGRQSGKKQPFYNIFVPR